MTQDVLVSVIIPTYNRVGLVQRALESVLAQTQPVAEILVVDDGSTDGTAEVLAQRFGPRVTVLRKANGGVSSARNLGLAAARGRFITLLDSDDLWSPEKTQLQLQWLQAHPDFGMVLCDVQRITLDGRPISQLRRRETIREDGWALRWLLGSPSLVPASVMMRREVYDTVGGFDERLPTAEDLEWHLRVAARWRIGVVEQALVQAVRGHDGLSSLSRTMDDYVDVVETAVRRSGPGVTAEDQRRAIANAHAAAAEEHFYRRRWRRAWPSWRRAWAHEQDPARRRALLLQLPMALRRLAAFVVHPFHARTP